MLARMSGLAAQIDTAIWAESARWGDAVRPQPFVRQDWLEAKQRLANFISTGTREGFGTGRRDEIIRQFRGYDNGTKPLYPLINAPEFSQHGGSIPVEGIALVLSQFNAGSPVIHYTLDGSDPRAVGGGVAASALTYSGPVPVNAWTVTLKARVREGTEWSALNEAVFSRIDAAPPLAVTEIHAALAAPDVEETGAGFTDKDDFEFIGLMNTGGEVLNLRDLKGTRGIAFSLSDQWLEQGARVLVVRRLAAFRHRYGAGPRVAGSFTGYLDDAGERLVLTAASGVTLTDFRYDTAAPWPRGLTGYSLTRRGTGLDAGLPGSWRTSLSPGGSPGRSDNSSYAGWKQGNGIVSDTGDTDGDGLMPLAEYASGGSPERGDASLHPSASLVTLTELGPRAWLGVSYTKQRGTDDVTAHFRQSTDLASWTPAPAELLDITSLPDGTELIEVRTVPVSSAGQFFIQLVWRTQP